MGTKFILTYLVLISFSAINLAQEKKSMCKIDYDMTLLLRDRENYSATLLYNNNISQFSYSNLEKEDSEKKDENNNIMIKYADTLSNIIINDKYNSKIYHFTEISTSRNTVWIEEKTPELNWVLVGETKVLGTLICNKATTSFRGRNYTAWYSSEMVGGYGPWKLQGLPGIILEAYDDKKEVVFRVNKITLPYVREITFDARNIKTISREEKKGLVSKENQKLKNFLISQQERGVSLEVEIINYDIEQD
jgi:GLPGLI family protein